MNGIKEKEELITPVVLNKKKSKFVAYTLWLFGGFFGVHHVYLGRDLHALVYITTLGGYFGVGWLRDLFRIPAYVADANDDPVFIEKFKREVKANQKPPFSVIRFTAAIAVAYFWAELFCSAIPEDEVYGINFRHLILLLPVVAASGIWAVGNIGRQQGSIWSPLIGAYLAYPSSYYIEDHSMWLLAIVVASGLSFDSFGKHWRLKPKKQKRFITRLFYLSLALAIYSSMIVSYLYFNAVITDSEGEEIKLSEAIQHFLTSPIWNDFKRSLEMTWIQAKNQGFWATWRQLVDLTDPRGEINAYKVLGLSQTASQSEVTSRWRALSRDNHPDKVKGSEEERRQAQERFMEIQQAYEILSNAKNRRQRRNRRSS